MGKIRSDLDKVVQYAKNIGITVTFKTYVPRSYTAAEVDFDSRRITVYQKPNESIRYLVASLLHELCHFTYHATNPKSYKVYDKWSGSFNKGEDDKSVRWGIYDVERRDISNMVRLYDLLGLNGVPRSYIHMQQEYDIWIYAFWYFRGRLPKKQEKKVKQLQLQFKHQIKASV